MAETAANSTSTHNDASTTRGGKGVHRPGDLPTPIQTPVVEDERVAADKARRTAEVANEISRILKGGSTLEILNVGTNSTADDIINAWQKLGCMIHPGHCGHENKKDNEKAFKELKKAARQEDVEDHVIDEVVNWDGVQGLDDTADDDDVDMPPVPEDNFPQPPVSIVDIYTRATPLIIGLATRPQDADATENLKGLNKEITEINEKYNEQFGKNDPNRIATNQWEIPSGYFQQQFTSMKENCNILKADPNNNKAKGDLERDKSLFKERISKYHLPEKWNEALNVFKESPQETKDTKTTPTIHYPWPTLQTDDGLIVGVRERKIGETQVCIETIKNGRIIRRLESASDFGQTKVDQYMSLTNYKSLSNAGLKYYRKDEADFKALHWVTMSVITNKNTAKGKKDPPTDCCVELKSKGLQMLTVSNVCNILGRKKGRAAIEKVCHDHGIPAPWDRPPQNTFYKPSKDGPKKPAAERWAEVDSLVSTANGIFVNNPASNGGGLTDPRVDLMVDRLDSLEKTVAKLVGELQKLAEGGRFESSMYVTS